MIEATVNSSHIMDHIDAPAGAAYQGTHASHGSQRSSRLHDFLHQPLAGPHLSPISNGVTTISFHGSRSTIAAASGSHHQFSSDPPALLAAHDVNRLGQRDDSRVHPHRSAMFVSGPAQ